MNSRLDRRQRNISITVAVLAGFALLSVALFFNKLSSPRIMSQQELQLNGAYVFDQPRIIKPFQLVDADAEDFTLERLQGVWSLLFFGYTYCPDICPTTLADLKKFKDLLAGTAWAEDTQIVLVSVDPGRDSVEQLHQYLGYFDPDFVGVTGEFMALQKLAANVNAAFSKSITGNGDSYLVDHTSNIVLVNAYGHYHGFFKPQATMSEGQFDPGKLKVTYQSIRESFAD
jgi:protein SCO1/2